jgi:outer membrane protein
MMMKFSFIRAAFIAALALLVSPVYADSVFGIYAGAGSWQQEYSGDVTSGIVDVDFEDDLALGDEHNNVFYVAVEHGVPVLPNLRFGYVDLSASGDSVLTRPIDFNGSVFNVSDSIVTDVDLTQMDLVMYYQLLDNVVSLDLGLAGRMVDGHIEVVSTTTTSRAEFKGLLPMIYAKARVDLPFAGLWFGVEGQGTGYDGNSLIDVTAHIGFESKWGLGTEAGWRKFHLKLKDFDDISGADFDVSGPYMALNLHF